MALLAPLADEPAGEGGSFQGDNGCNVFSNRGTKQHEVQIKGFVGDWQSGRTAQPLYQFASAAPSRRMTKGMCTW